MHTDETNQNLQLQQPEQLSDKTEILESSEVVEETSEEGVAVSIEETVEESVEAETPVKPKRGRRAAKAAEEERSDEVILSAPVEEMVDDLLGLNHDPGLNAGAETGETEPTSDSDAPAEPLEPIEYREFSSTELQSAVEALLFCTHKPMTLGKLREVINPSIPEDDYRTAVSNIMSSYFDDSKGIELVEVANGYQFRTKTDNKDILRRFYQIAPMKLTNAMLEVIAITAYNQPVTKEMIEKIRGVDSSHLVRALLDKKMIRIVGKSEDLGKPMLYGTTKEFLELFGLRDLNALPSLRDIEDMLPANEVGQVSEELLLAKEMEGIVDASKPLDFNDLEMDEFDENETEETLEKQEASRESRRAPRENGGSGATIHGTEAPGVEATNDVVIETETPRPFAFGPKGTA